MSDEQKEPIGYTLKYYPEGRKPFISACINTLSNLQRFIDKNDSEYFYAKAEIIEVYEGKVLKTLKSVPAQQVYKLQEKKI